MATEADGDEDLLVHELPIDMEDGDPVRRLAHLLSPLHTGEGDAPQPFRPPPPLQAATFAEPRLSFRGWLGAPRHWDQWVAKLQPIHADIWRRLGIHDAVLASTCRFRRDASALLHLASFWCPRTNTFAFPWGEATITLHDIAVLAGFPAYGTPVPAPLAPEWCPDEAALNGVRLGFNRSACKKAHHSAWVKHFLTDDDQEHEHAAFLALWLTRFVLPGHPESTMRQCLFPIAVRLARGERIALGPAVLASLYRDLRDIKAFLVAAAAAATTGNADMLSSLSLYAPLHILQLWMWERFPMLRPGRENPLMDGDPMAARWHDLSRKINPTLIREALSSADSFLWQPYSSSMHTTGWIHSSNLIGNDDLKTLAHCLRPCELVGMDCIEQYLPHRVARQFGLDQDVPVDVPRANQNWAVAWQTFELVGMNVAFIIPQAKPGITSRYAQWWRQQLPRRDLDDAGAPSIPVQLKTSKRKVKKTLVALEAEEEKERRLKKAHVSPVTSDKKRKLEEFYDSKLSDWLTAARNEVNDTAGGSFQWGSSLPKYDTSLDEALLPNVGATNDDAVLLLPRKQATSFVVMSMNDRSINPVIGDRGTLIADIPTYVPSPDVTGSSEEGTTMVMEASGASDTPEEVLAPAAEDKEEKNIIEGTSCVAVTNQSVKNMAVLMEVDEGNAVSEEVGRAAKEANEVATECQQELDTGTANYLHVAVDLPEEKVPIKHTNNGGGCSKVSCTTEGNTVAGGLSTDAGETACHDFVVQEQSEFLSVEVIGGGDHQIVEKDNEEKPQDADHRELSEVDHTEIAEHKVHSRSDIEKTEEVHAVECPKMYGTIGLTGRDTVDEKHGVVPEDGNDKMEKNKGFVLGIRDKKISEISEVEHAKAEDVKCMMEEDTDSKSEDVPVLENAGSDETYGAIEEDTDGRLDEIHDVNAEAEQSDGHEMNSDGSECVLQEDLQTKDEAPREVDRKEKLLADGNLRDEPQQEEDTKEKPVPNGEDLPEKHVDVSKDEQYENINDAFGVEKAGRQDKKITEKDIHEHIEETTLVLQVEGQNMGLTTVGTEETPEQITKTEEKELDKIFVDDSKNSTDGRIPCSSATTLLKGDQMEVSHEDMMQDQHIQNVELIDQMEPSSDAAALMVERVHEHKTLDTYEVATLKQEQDRIVTMEKTTLEGSHMMDTGVRPTLVTMEVNETHASVVILDQNISDMDKQLAMEKRNDIGIVVGNNKMDMSKAADIIVCDEQQINQIEVNEVESTIGIRSQELIDNAEQLAMEGRQDLVGTITEKNKLNTLDVVDILSYGEHQIDSTDRNVNEVESTKGTLGKEPFNDKEQLAIEERQYVGIRSENKKVNMSEYTDIISAAEYQITPSGMANDEAKSTHRIQNQEPLDNKVADRSETSLEEAYKAAGHGVNNFAVAMDVNDSIQSTEAINMELLSMADKQHHGVEKVNEKRILEDASTAGSGDLYSEAVDLDVNMAGSIEGTLNKCALGAKNGEAAPEKKDQETPDVNTKRDLMDIDALECVGVKPDEAGIMFHETLLTAPTINTSGFSMADKQHHGVETVNEKRILEDASTAVSGDLCFDAINLDVNMAGSREGTVNQCALGAKKGEVAPEKKDQETPDVNIKRDLMDIDALEFVGVKPHEAGISFQETLLTTPAINTSGFSMADMQNHGVEKVNEKTILKYASTAGSGGLYSDAVDLDVNMAGSREETLNQCVLGAKKGEVVPEKDQETADVNTKRDFTDINAFECVEMKPDEAKITFQETLTAPVINTSGFEISSENKHKEASFGKLNITEVEGSDSNQALMKDAEEPLPSDPKSPVEVKQEKLENETEMSICRDNDEESEKDHTATEVTITPNLDKQGENGYGLAEKSTKSYENASNPKGAACLLKLGKSSIEEVKRTYNTRSMYLKDIKESLGRIRAEPINRVQTTGVGNYSRHAVQEPISVCKEIKVPFRDSSRDFGRERAPELVHTSPPEETSRWRQEQYALQILEDVQNSRLTEKTRMEMEIRVLKAQIASMERQVMNLDHSAEVKSRSKRH